MSTNDKPDTCDKCPRDYYTTLRRAGEEYHLCETCHRRLVLGR